ncbi:MAG TPA: nuclear transport factor 2 family protein, partial [Thermoleophilaceae bacterium]
LWDAFARGGIEAVLEIADPDVEWEPYGGGGVVYHGHEGLRAYMDERTARGEQTEARLYSAFAKGDYVVARGEVRIQGEHGMVTMQPGWLYEFREGRLVQFRGFATQEAALKAAGLVPEDAASVVRELIDAFNKRQTERMAELVTDDCEWLSLAGKGHYVGPDGVREYVNENFGGALSVSVAEYTVREIGGLISISGSLNVIEANGAMAQRQVHWLMTVREGKIARAQSFIRREDATAAARAARGAAG